MPGTPETNGLVPRIVVDRVNFKDGDRWPEEADGEGKSLEVLDASGDPDDPANVLAFSLGAGAPAGGCGRCPGRT